MHREIKEEWKSGNITGEIRIGPIRPQCAIAALNIVVPPLFKIVGFINILHLTQSFIMNQEIYKH